MASGISTVSLSLLDFLQKSSRRREKVREQFEGQEAFCAFLTASMSFLRQKLQDKFQENSYSCDEEDGQINTTKLNLKNGTFIMLKNTDTYTCLFFMEMNSAITKLKADQILPLPKKLKSNFFDFKTRKLKINIESSNKKLNTFKIFLKTIHINAFDNIKNIKNKAMKHKEKNSVTSTNLVSSVPSDTKTSEGSCSDSCKTYFSGIFIEEMTKTHVLKQVRKVKRISSKISVCKSDFSSEDSEEEF